MNDSNENHAPDPQAAEIKNLLAEMRGKEDTQETEQEPEENPLNNLNFDAHGPAAVIPVEGLRPEMPRETTPLQGPLFERPEEPDPSSRTIPRLGKITVSDSDKDTYFLAFLDGIRVELPVVIDAGERPRRFLFRDLSMGEKDLCYLLLELVSNDAAPGLANRHFNLYIQTRIYLSTVEEDGKPWPASQPDFVLPSDPKELLAQVKKQFESFFGGRYASLVDAYTIFETRITILEDAVSNSDFRKPAGTN